MIDWHVAQWKTLLGNGLDRIGHATLLVGDQGLGQREFADRLAALLLCETPIRNPAADQPPAACGTCPSCHWLDTDSHPDYRLVQADDAIETDEAGTDTGGGAKTKKASSAIKIDSIRALEDFVFVGSHRHGRRVVVIDPAEAMNAHAANALLKILEEPPASVYFILVSKKEKVLLPTLRSRCRSLHFQRPPRDQAEKWLRSAGADTRSARFLDVANGAPEIVIDWQNAKLLPALEALIDSLFNLLRHPNPDPLVLAGQWDALLKKESALSLDMVVEATQRWLFDISTQVTTGALRYHGAWASGALRNDLSLENLVRGWRELLRFRRSARHPLNQLLFLEDFASQTVRSLAPATRP